MIVDFTIENFRSIKSEQLLSFYAENKPKHHAGNISYIDNEHGILKTCAVYGSNAAGKTNLILAFDALRKLIVRSGDLKDGELISCYEPYLLSKSTIDKPTCFEIEFFIEETRYLYRIEYNQREILFEKLDYYSSARTSNIFIRSSSDWKEMRFGESFKGGKKQIAFFANNSYLSKAGNTPDSPQVVRTIYNYFRKSVETMLTAQSIGVFNWNDNPGTVSIINTFLNKTDLGISKFEIENSNNNLDDITFPKDMPKGVSDKLLIEFSKEEVFFHESDYGELVRFEKNMESRGTQRLFKLLPFIIRVLEQGSVLFFDEIENSFHPHVAELIIKLFNDPLVNIKNAQLIFTTHNLSLMSSSTMRKDQIYLTDKSIEEGTEFNCLESYDAALKDSSPFSKWYDEGRLGAIPALHYREISDSIKKVFSDA